MTQLLLNPTFFNAALIAFALLTPVVALVGTRLSWWRGRRLPLAIGALGPFALLFWVFHNLVLAVVGFDRMWSVVIILAVAGVLGFLGGRWVGAENLPAPDSD